MTDFKPAFPYSTTIELLIPTYTTQKGVKVKNYPDEGVQMNCSFKTYGGTESIQNDVYSVINTANVETWYRPDIKADCRIRILETRDVYEIIGKPENINMRNQFVKFKVRGIEGDA